MESVDKNYDNICPNERIPPVADLQVHKNNADFVSIFMVNLN